MYIWDFDSRSEEWTRCECANIMEIMDIASRLFGHGGITLIPNKQIIKNTQDIRSIEYKGDHPVSTSKIKKKYYDMIKLLKSDSKYEFVLKELEGIIGEVFADDISQQMNEDDVRELVNGIQNLSENCECPEISALLDEFVDKIRELPFKEVILGEAYKDDKIIIYMKAIENSNGVDKHALVEEVLVHELYHAMHYNHASYYIKRSWASTSVKNKPVKESLADYFAYLYILRMYYRSNDQVYSKLSKDLEKKWNTHKFPNYPYSGAKVFGYGKDKSFYEADLVEKDCLFRLVQNKALKQWSTPYRVITKTLECGEKAGKEEYYRRHPIENITNYRVLDDENEREDYVLRLKSIKKNFKIEMHTDRMPNYTIHELRWIDDRSREFIIPDDSNVEFEKRFYSGSIYKIEEYFEQLFRQQH